MASSTLDPDNIPESDRSLGKGHDNAALGPSDVTDTGSDVQPGVHAVEELDLGLDKGTNEDPDSRILEVEGDSDAAGSGERMSAGRDSEEMGGDINVDRVDHIDTDEDPDLASLDLPPPSQQADQQQDHKR